MVDQKISNLGQVIVHCWQNIPLAVFELKGYECNLALDGLGNMGCSFISIHKKNFFYTKKIIALNDDEVVPFIDQIKVIRSVFAQIFWRYLNSMIQIHHRHNSMHGLTFAILYC